MFTQCPGVSGIILNFKLKINNRGPYT